MGKKVVYRIFTIADYDREAAYLKKMHGQGWKLKKVNYSPFIIAVRYTFERTSPQEMAYQLDFRPIKKAERDSYYQLFDDCGWEHITIYNDAWSKLEMVKRLLVWRFFPAIVALFFATYLVLSVAQKGSDVSWLVKCILLIDTVLLLILFGQLVHIGLSFWRMKRELKD